MESRTVSLQDLSAADRELVRAASEAAGNAYAPYSGFAVGAAVRTRRGAVHTGANLENSCYGLGICAEVSAVAGANAAGDYDVAAIAVVGRKFWPEANGALVVTPCGRCRQVIAEAGQIAGIDVAVLSCNGDLTEILPRTISTLLPEAFGPANLGLADAWPNMRAALRDEVHGRQKKAALR